MTARFHHLLATAVLTVAALGAGACTAGLQTEGTLVYDYPAVYVDPPPAHVYYEPRVYYRGRYAYLVDDRWYYPTDRGWVVFREEPRELQRYRVSRSPGRDYRYRGVPEQRRHDTPDYRYRAPEYGAPVPPPARYRTPATPTPGPALPAAPTPSPRYRTPAAPPPAQYRAAPPPSPAPRAAPPRAAPPPRAPAPPAQMPRLVPAPPSPPPQRR